jgi:hypothetical protein
MPSSGLVELWRLWLAHGHKAFTVSVANAFADALIRYGLYSPLHSQTDAETEFLYLYPRLEGPGIGEAVIEKEYGGFTMRSKWCFERPLRFGKQPLEAWQGKIAPSMLPILKPREALRLARKALKGKPQ